MRKLLLCAFVAGLAIAAAHAASVSYVTGPPDPSNGTLNNIIGQLNGSQCIASGATPQVCNGTRGVVTTNSLSTAVSTNAAYVITNSAVAANSVVNCQQQGYSGTITTNGWPFILSCVPAAGQITVNITNVNPTNALNGTVQIGFAIEQN
jgi:hypothetical protein